MANDGMYESGSGKVELIAAAAAIASSSVAYGAPVRFENDLGLNFDFTTLDLTQSASDQTFGGVGDVTGTSIYIDYFGDFYPTFSYQHTYMSGNGAELLGGGFSDRYAAPQAFGAMIDDNAAGTFGNVSFEFAFDACDYYYPYDCTSGFRGILPQGEATYVGARLSINGETHFGWIGLELQGAFFDVFAWGYETEANTAVGAGVPAPGAMGVLAVGAVGALGRKKRAS